MISFIGCGDDIDLEIGIFCCCRVGFIDNLVVVDVEVGIVFDFE